MEIFRSKSQPINSVRNIDEAEKCHICEKEFIEENVKVQDHRHLTGKFIVATHQSCNLNLKLPNFIPIIVHNLSGYDSHFFVEALSFDEKEIKVVVNTEEKYISIATIILLPGDLIN